MLIFGVIFGNIFLKAREDISFPKIALEIFEDASKYNVFLLEKIQFI